MFRLCTFLFDCGIFNSSLIFHESPTDPFKWVFSTSVESANQLKFGFQGLWWSAGQITKNVISPLAPFFSLNESQNFQNFYLTNNLTNYQLAIWWT